MFLFRPASCDELLESFGNGAPTVMRSARIRLQEQNAAGNEQLAHLLDAVRELYVFQVMRDDKTLHSSRAPLVSQVATWLSNSPQDYDQRLAPRVQFLAGKIS